MSASKSTSTDLEVWLARLEAAPVSTRPHLAATCTHLTLLDATADELLVLEGLARDAGLFGPDPPAPHPLSVLTLFPALQELEVFGEGPTITDVAPLAALTGLRRLRLKIRFKDLSPLAGMTGLERLDLGASWVRDLRPLRRLSGLRHLDLTYTAVTAIGTLGRMSELRWLSLYGTKVKDLGPLAGLRHLEHLDLGWMTRLWSLHPLSDLSSLRWLGLWRANALDLTPLYGLPALTTIDLGDSRVSGEQLAKLKAVFPNLQGRMPYRPAQPTLT